MADSRTARMAHAQRVGALVVVMIGSAATVAAQYGTDGAGCGSARLACKGMSQEVATPTLRPIVYDRTEYWVSSSALKGDAAVRRCDRWLYERFSCAKPRCPS